MMWSSLKQKMPKTGDSEPEQAIKIRLSIGLVIILYFCFPWRVDQTLWMTLSSFPSMIALSYYGLALSIVLAIFLNPRPSAIRRVFGMVIDLSSLSILMYFAGQESVFLFVLYLWVILGNGFRYGVSYLYVSFIIGLIGFNIAVSGGEYWQHPQHQPFGLSLIFLLILVPLYSAFLITKLHAAIATAKQANEAKSRFLASMSHELRTPLNGVIGVADLLGETKLSSQQRDFVSIMRASAHTLLSLIENVLDIAKIEAGKILINQESFDLHQLVHSIISMQKPIGQTKGLKVVCSIDPDLPFILQGDSQHLRQVLLNLIGNGIKFTDSGFVKLVVSKTAISREDLVQVRFEIIDTGIGIPESEQAVVFNHFTQVATVAQRTVGGTGLGTTISKELVELMGGKIGLQSVLGEGSTFWFELPFAPMISTDLKLAENPMLILSSDASQHIIQPALEGWSVNYKRVDTSAKAFLELMQAAQRDEPYHTMMVDQVCMHDIDPIQFACMVQAEPLLSSLSLILINPSVYSQHDPKLRDHFVCIIRDLDAKPQLFNAIHAAQSSHFVQDEKVVTLAQHYAAQSHARPLTILIAEDNKVNQQVLTGVLNHAGHKTLVSETGEDALDILAEQIEGIDMLIVDMNMPDYSGPEVVRALRYIDTQIHIPVIMLTADATPEAKKVSLDAGADEFMTKPINSRILLESIAKLAQQSNFSESASEAKTKTKAHVNVKLADSKWLVEETVNELLSLGGSAFVEQLIDGFETDGKKHLQYIVEAAEDDYLAFRESLHALKGSSTEMGAYPIAELCRRGEGLKPDAMGSTAALKVANDLQIAFSETVSALRQSVPRKVHSRAD